MIWTRCEQEMPDADTTVLVHCPASDEPVWLGYFDGERWCDVSALPLEEAVTHWAPMPEPPSAKELQAQERSQAADRFYGWIEADHTSAGA